MTRFSLPRDEVHVWWSPSAAAPAALQNWLSAQEQVRYARFHFEHDRQSFGAAHAMLRLLLADYGSAHAWSDFDTGLYGKPFIAGAMHFNLSHTRGLVACAFSSTAEIGVDVETELRGNDWRSLMPQVLSCAEIAALEALPAVAQQSQFYAMWTRKEAWSKALGKGLQVDFRALDVLCREPDVYLAGIETAPPFQAAVACMQAPAMLTVRRFDWTQAGSCDWLK